MTSLSVGGARFVVPAGWEVRARRQEPVRPGAHGNLLVHAATVPMPALRGDFGSEVVDRLRSDDVFAALLEYDPADADAPLFSARGLPTPTARDFSPAVLQRTLPGRSGAQWFFQVSGRPFCLHAVVGAHARRAIGAARLAALLRGVTVGART